MGLEATQTQTNSGQTRPAPKNQINPNKHVREALRKQYLELARRLGSYPELKTAVAEIKAKMVDLALKSQT